MTAPMVRLIPKLRVIRGIAQTTAVHHPTLASFAHLHRTSHRTVSRQPVFIHRWIALGLTLSAVCATGLLILLSGNDARSSKPSPTTGPHARAGARVSHRPPTPAQATSLSPADLATLRELPCFQSEASVNELLQWLEQQRTLKALEHHLGKSPAGQISQVSGTQVERFASRLAQVAQLPDGLIEQNGRLLHPSDTLLLSPSQPTPATERLPPTQSAPESALEAPAELHPPASPPRELTGPDLRAPETAPPRPAPPRAAPPQQAPLAPGDDGLLPRTLAPRPEAFLAPTRPYRSPQDTLLFPHSSPPPPNAGEAEGRNVPTPATKPPSAAVPLTPPINVLPPPPAAGAPAVRPETPRATMPPPAPVESIRSPSPSLPLPQDPHAAIFASAPYPSAKQCQKCHEQIYREWSVSGHAYAAVSPMFHQFEQRINELTSGTIGHFCLRCHSPIGSALGLPREANLYEAPAAAIEGVTCVACHRVRQRYQRVNGERRIEPGDIFAPVYAGGDGHGLRDVLAHRDQWKVKTSPADRGPGQPIHAASIQFEQLSSSHFCVSCHQVAVYPGIKLEVVWEQYRASPACKQGISCQECHMGKAPGRAEGYTTGPAAVVASRPTNPHRKHSNHMFFGPGYSIAHPGTFPFHPKANTWRYDQWLEFDWRAGWGTDAFEDALAAGAIYASFPPTWQNVDDRYDARQIIDENLRLLAEKKHSRKVLMENGSQVEGPFFATQRRLGKPLRFHYVVTNTNSGHNMPSGSLGAQPQIWLNVVLTAPDGSHAWESGYVDSQGDLADLHSLDVAAGRIPHDHQLFNLQTKFITTNVKGTDREMYLPINVDVDPLPFIRPSGFPITTMNHPPTIRMEGHSLPPLGHRKARYHVPGHLIQMPGTWRLSVRMRSRAEPIYFMRFVRATPTMMQAMNERMLDFHEYSVEFEIR